MKFPPFKDTSAQSAPELPIRQNFVEASIESYSAPANLTTNADDEGAFDRHIISFLIDEIKKTGASLIAIHADSILNLEIDPQTNEPQDRAAVQMVLAQEELHHGKMRQILFFQEFFDQCCKRDLGIAFICPKTSLKTLPLLQNKKTACYNLTKLCPSKYKDGDDQYPMAGIFEYPYEYYDSDEEFNKQKNIQELCAIRAALDTVKSRPKASENNGGVFILSRDMSQKVMLLNKHETAAGEKYFESFSYSITESERLGVIHDIAFCQKLIMALSKESSQAKTFNNSGSALKEIATPLDILPQPAMESKGTSPSPQPITDNATTLNSHAKKCNLL